ncbi:hypothetical protein P3S68_019872 [Capsicum galapagoense]
MGIRNKLEIWNPQIVSFKKNLLFLQIEGCFGPSWFGMFVTARSPVRVVTVYLKEVVAAASGEKLDDIFELPSDDSKDDDFNPENPEVKKMIPNCQEECSLSDGKDNLVKLWDAKLGKELSSFHGHKNTVLCVKWNQNGNWILSASKDQIIKLYDIRAMKDLESFPPQVEITNAHETGVWDLSWHPIGYLLCSGSNDQTTNFWCRKRPGDSARDKFNLGQQGLGDQNNVLGRMPGNIPGFEAPSTPGAFASGILQTKGTIPGVGTTVPLSIPSLDSSPQGEHKTSMPVSMSLGAPPLPHGPHPSLLASNQQQAYQQNMQQVQQQQSLPQQLTSLPLQTSNLPQLEDLFTKPLQISKFELLRSDEDVGPLSPLAISLAAGFSGSLSAAASHGFDTAKSRS